MPREVEKAILELNQLKLNSRDIEISTLNVYPRNPTHSDHGPHPAVHLAA